MFEEVEIEKIITSAAIINRGSWRIMEKLGFERVGEKKSTYFDGDNILMSYHYIMSSQIKSSNIELFYYVIILLRR